MGFLSLNQATAADTNAKALINAYKTNNWSYLTKVSKTSKNLEYSLLSKWLYVKDSKSNASFEEIANFILKYPDFPEHKKINALAESKMSYNSDRKIAEKFCKSITPSHGNAHKVCNVLHASNTKENSKKIIFIKKAWVNGDFSSKEEQEFIQKYSKILQESDHYQRVMRLLWQDKTTAAKNIYSKLSASHKVLYDNIKQIRANKPPKIAPEHYKNPLVIYSLIKFYKERGHTDRVDDLLIQAGKNVPYPEKWIGIRKLRAREAINLKNYKEAYNIIKNHGLTEGVDFADSEWLSGWLALTYLKDYKTASQHFARMYNGVKYTMSKVRAAYWLGMAYKKAGNNEESHKWFEVAGQHPEQFFGQIALFKLGKKNFSLPAAPKIDKESASRAEGNVKYKIAKILLGVKEGGVAKQFLNSSVRHSKSKAESYMYAKLPLSYNLKNITVEVAKEAAQKGHLFYDIGYPRIKLNFNPLIEKAIIFAITRQESNFYQYAKSSANALGMMQLLPSTAKQNAAQLGVQYSLKSLTSDPLYNMNLGQFYLHKLLNAYDSNLYLTFMGYNAGTGNVRKWLKMFGDPSKFTDLDKVINWIESTPFNETRNYVYRILENLQVYRYILNSKNGIQPIEIQEDLLNY
ncbi:MAG: hypothetical protein BGO27_01110 [Alphaproteobacteria bacterium 33-17]|nr:MAG: hypothetical protein BGO27_01110 [Alphaproteobacteria bacterium 33-17]